MRFQISLLSLIMLSTIGCGSSEFDMAPVSGVVTLDGEPVADARIIFSPQRTGKEALSAGPASDGTTDETGRFTLATSIEGTTGAVVGAHTVTISTYLAESDRSKDTYKVVRDEEVPAKYNKPGALTFDVPSDGTKQADFKLESSKKKKR